MFKKYLSMFDFLFFVGEWQFDDFINGVNEDISINWVNNWFKLSEQKPSPKDLLKAKMRFFELNIIGIIIICLFN